MPEQKFDLLKIAAALAAKFCAGAAQIVGTEAFDADLSGQLLDDGPDRPDGQAIALDRCFENDLA